MPDSKITALTALTAADPANDMFPIVDVSDTSMAASGTTKRISINNLLAASGTATLASATISGDLTVDTSTLKVDSANNRVGVLTATPTAPLDILGNGLADALLIRGNDNANCKIRMANSGAGGEEFSISVGYPGASNSSLVFRSITAAINRYVIDQTGAHTWATNAGTAMTLNATGLLVGTANNFASSRLCVQGTAGTSTPDVTIGIPVNSSGNTNLAIGRSASTNGYIFLDAYKAGVGGTELVLNSVNGGAVLIGLSTVVAAGGCLQLKSGITFPATQVASSDANTLDDYEEGSFVPTLNSGTFSSASCRYTKIGNMVTIFFDVTVGTGGGDRITNLPFAAASTSTVASGIYTNNQTYAAGTTAPVVVVGGSSSTLFFRTVGTGVAFSAMTLTAAANLTGSISYFV